MTGAALLTSGGLLFLMTMVVDGIVRISELLKLDHVLIGNTNVSLITGFKATKDPICSLYQKGRKIMGTDQRTRYFK